MLLVNIYHSNPCSPSSSSTRIYCAVKFLRSSGMRSFLLSAILQLPASFGCYFLLRIRPYIVPFYPLRHSLRKVYQNCSHPTLERREHVRCSPAKPIAMTPSPTTCPSEESPFGESFYSGRLIEPVIHLIYNTRRKP